MLCWPPKVASYLVSDVLPKIIPRFSRFPISGGFFRWKILKNSLQQIQEDLHLSDSIHNKTAHFDDLYIFIRSPCLVVRVLNHHFSTKSVWNWGISDQKILKNTWENNDSSSTGGGPRIFQPRPWKKIPGSWPVTGSRVAWGDIPGSAMAMLKWTYFWLPVWRLLYLLTSWSTPQKRSTLVQSSAIMFTISDSHHCCWIFVEVSVCYVCGFCLLIIFLDTDTTSLLIGTIGDCLLLNSESIM